MLQRRSTRNIKVMEDRPDREKVKEPTKVCQRVILNKMYLHGGEENCNREQFSFVEGCNESHWLYKLYKSE